MSEQRTPEAGYYECPRCDGTGGVHYASREAWLAEATLCTNCDRGIDDGGGVCRKCDGTRRVQRPDSATPDYLEGGWANLTTEGLRAIVEKAIAKEREACEQVCWAYRKEAYERGNVRTADVAQECAERIAARGGPRPETAQPRRCARCDAELTVEPEAEFCSYACLATCGAVPDLLPTTPCQEPAGHDGDHRSTDGVTDSRWPNGGGA